MTYEDEASRIQRIAALDPSFRPVPNGILRNAEARLLAAPSADGFRLEALRLMALGGNGHSRAIANRGAQVAPIRFIWLADGPCVAEGPHLGARLVAINGVGIAEVFREMRPLLAGTEQRARVLAGFMFAWPPAIALATGRQGPPHFRLLTVSGERLDLDGGDVVAAEPLYPVREIGPAGQMIAAKGLADVSEARSGVFHRVLREQVRYVRIGDLAAAASESTSHRLAEALADLRRARQVIVDLRGNPGGSFFGALQFARQLPEAAPGAAVAILVDKFTFSAALVTAALMKVHAGGRIIGEEMGDAARFHAEGGTETLPRSGLDIRYSDGWHDWANGRADPVLTPPAIAAEMVAAGSLRPEVLVGPTAKDLKEGRDAALERAVALLL